MSKMDEGERQEVCAKLEWEGGFDYLIDGSDFPSIKDQHFHELRVNFVRAAAALDAYLQYEKYLLETNEDEMYK